MKNDFIMMKVFNEPKINEWASIIERPSIDAAQLNDNVRNIIDEVIAGGDAAIKKSPYNSIAFPSMN